MQQESVSPNPSAINGKSVAKYALLPGIFPRLRRLAGALSKFMFMFTQIFGSVGLIDRNHPCLKLENIGYYRFTDVIGLAASNVVFDRKHIPQTIMFFVVISSIILTAAIFFAMLANVFIDINAAHAQFFSEPASVNGISYSKNDDWALTFLARIFGPNDFFPTGAGGNMWFTTLLTGMLKHYSLAMLVIGAFMILYLMIITLTEAANTGKPFGTRFDSIWAPLRLAFAIGLLIPISSAGYNGAQLITFQAAVWGSNLATNSWLAGFESLNKNGKNFFAATMADNGYRFARDMFVINLCVEGIRALDKKDYGDGNVYAFKSGVGVGDFYTYSFGTKNAPDFCGQVKVLKIPETTARPAGLGASWPEKTAAAYQEIADEFLPVFETAVDIDGVYQSASAPAIMKPYLEPLAKSILVDNQKHFGHEATTAKLTSMPGTWIKENYWKHLGRKGIQGSRFFEEAPYPELIKSYNDWLMATLSQDASHGWTTAGVFYLRMSSAMSMISKVVNNPPTVVLMPANFSKAYATADNPTASDQQARDACNNLYDKIVSIFGAASESCAKYKLSSQLNTFLRSGASWFQRSVIGTADESIFGGTDFDRAMVIPDAASPTNESVELLTQPLTGALYNFAHIDSKDLHPLGAVISWGTLLMTMGSWCFVASLGGFFLGGGFASIAITLGGLFMLPGFLLAFYVPFMPFIYFMFAVIEWMISILEAVIGMPLWALSLITLEGDGLGELGMNGVKSLFEIVLRPTIIVMALLCSIIIFTASMGFYNQAMSLFADALGGASEDSGMFATAVNGFGMVFMYVFGVYSLANSSFKLIDAIPDNFARWGGLPSGFGSGIKAGHADIGGALTGGLVFSAFSSMRKTVSSAKFKKQK